MSLSIGIVTKDRPETIKGTLERLSELNLDDKVIVVDGSESEETEKVCDKFDVNYIEQDEGRRVAARNQVLENCETEYLAYIDDDAQVSNNWFEAIKENFEEENVVGVTGRLEGETPELGGISGKVRELLFGGKEDFGEILNNGVINGDFFYNERKEVDHMVGCNMAFDVEALREVGGFQEEYDIGNAYREETAPSYRMKNKGKIVYNPDTSVDHLKQGDEDHSDATWMFYNPYLTRYFLTQEDVIKGFSGHLEHFLITKLRHFYFLSKSILNKDMLYLYYLKGELLGIRDFLLFDRRPSEYV